jgi:hypothetical protein
MIPKKPAPDAIRRGNRFSEKIMHQHMTRRLEGNANDQEA